METFKNWKFVEPINWFMAVACEKGYLDIVQFMIEKGATNLNWGLRNSCLTHQIKVVKYMIGKGASCQYSFYGSLFQQNCCSFDFQKKFVNSLSLLELQKYNRLYWLPVNMRRMIKTKLCFLHLSLVQNENVFPVLKLFFKK